MLDNFHFFLWHFKTLGQRQLYRFAEHILHWLCQSLEVKNDHNGTCCHRKKKKKKTASYLSQPKNLAFHWFAWPIQTEEYVFIGCPWPLGCQQNGIHFTTVNKSFFSCCPTTLWQTYLKLRNRFVVTHQNWISPRCNMKNYAFSKHNNLPPHLNTLRTC